MDMTQVALKAVDDQFREEICLLLAFQHYMHSYRSSEPLHYYQAGHYPLTTLSL